MMSELVLEEDFYLSPEGYRVLQKNIILKGDIVVLVIAYTAHIIQSKNKLILSA